MTDGSELVVEAAPTSQSSIADPVNRNDKVGGWLLFFCSTLVVFNPLVTLGFTGYGLLSLVPVLDRVPVVAIAVAALDTLVSLGLAAFSLYAGVSLWRRRAGAVQLAKAFLIAGALYTLVSPFLWLLPGIPRDSSVPVFETLLQSWRGLLYYAIWLNYLRSSKRVQATYRDASAPA